MTVAAFSFRKSIYVAFPESHRLHTYSKLGAQLSLDSSKSRLLQLLYERQLSRGSALYGITDYSIELYVFLTKKSPSLVDELVWNIFLKWRQNAKGVSIHNLADTTTQCF
ncbi:hypothetical protein C0J52_20828 [Blattella germanica]|nr:hypothetical protein C0J52_20828 [Blattella germanica]